MCVDMDSRRKLFVVAGGVAVGAGVVLAIQTEEPLYAGLLGVLGALVSGWQAPTGKEGLRNGVLSAVVALPVVLVGVATVAALRSGEGAESFGVAILGMLIFITWILLGLLVPLMAFGALAGFLRGRLTDLEPEPTDQGRGSIAGGGEAGGHGRTGAPGRGNRQRTDGRREDGTSGDRTTGSGGDYSGGSPTDRPNTWSVTDEGGEDDTGAGDD